MYKIIKLVKSKRKNKRYRVYLENKDHYDFGLDSGKTYIDHQNKTKRDNYRKRHFLVPYRYDRTVSVVRSSKNFAKTFRAFWRAILLYHMVYIIYM